MSIKEFCTTHVVTAWEGDKVRDVARKMEEMNVGAVVVTDSKSAPRGILTDRDIVVKVVSPGKDPASTVVSSVMTHHVTTLKEDEGIMGATRIMAEHGVRRLPVVNGKGKVIGILSVDDLLMVLEREFNNLSKTIAQNLNPDVGD